MTDPTSMLARMMPGFDFLQRLGTQAQGALPAFSQWVAPTLDPKELDKRIADLKAVQFWLEQNAKMVATTVQAMEVQRMTLATLHSMNVPLESMREALLARAPASSPTEPEASPAAPGWPAAPAASAAAEEAEPPRPPASRSRARKGEATGAPGAAASPLVDPLQWWGALTQQFTTLAGEAFKDAAGGAGPWPGPGSGAAGGPARGPGGAERGAPADAAADPASSRARGGAPGATPRRPAAKRPPRSR